jgi:deoxyadenosine/deoxycytidine kinase
LDDISGGLAARDIVDDYIAQVIKSQDVNPEQMMQARHWKWYEDVAAVMGASLLPVIRRDVNPDELVRRDALDDYIDQVINSRAVNSEQTTKTRHWKWYEDLAAAWGATLILRDVNPEELARRDALTL